MQPGLVRGVGFMAHGMGQANQAEELENAKTYVQKIKVFMRYPYPLMALTFPFRLAFGMMSESGIPFCEYFIATVRILTQYDMSTMK